jgi:hypothetical protein
MENLPVRFLLKTLLLLPLCATAQTPAEPVPVTGGAPVAATAAPAPVLENVIRWSTASEVENFGYDVFRGLAEEGPFERVNDSPIPGHGTTDVPQKYEYRDTSIAADTAYWYYVESISMQGEREKFTPVFRAKPKTLE